MNLTLDQIERICEGPLPLSETDRQFSDHYRFIGALKRKHEQKQWRRVQIIFVSLIILWITTIWT